MEGGALQWCKQTDKKLKNECYNVSKIVTLPSFSPAMMSTGEECGFQCK